MGYEHSPQILEILTSIYNLIQYKYNVHKTKLGNGLKINKSSIKNVIHRCIL